MSLKTMLRVWEKSTASGTQLLLMLALADFADDDGFCWPSQEKLAQRMRCQRDTVGNHIERAIANKEMLSFKSYNKDGYRSSNRYIIMVGLEKKDIIKTITEKTELSYSDAVAALETQPKEAENGQVEKAKKAQAKKEKRAENGKENLVPPMSERSNTGCMDDPTQVAWTIQQDPSVNHQYNHHTPGEEKTSSPDQEFDSLFPREEETFLPEGKKERLSHWDALMGGRVGSGELEQETEGRLHESGWEIKGPSSRGIKQALILFLTYTRFKEVPASDGQRSRYYKAMRDLSDEFGADELRRLLPKVERIFTEIKYDPPIEAYLKRAMDIKAGEGVKLEEPKVISDGKGGFYL